MELVLAQYGALALATGAVGFVLGGLVKGVIGFGLPLIAVPILATVIDPKVAVAMMTVPVLCSNVWLVTVSGRLAALVGRFWPLIIMLSLCTFIGAQFFARMDARIASLMVGIGILLVCLAQAFPLRVNIQARQESWLGPVVGTIAGTMGGLTNFFAPALVAYLMALRVDKEMFVAAMALFFVVASTPLFGSLAMHSVLDLDVLLVSALATLLVLLGLAIGAALRRVIPQGTFEKILLGGLVLIGLNLIRKGLF